MERNLGGPWQGASRKRFRCVPSNSALSSTSSPSSSARRSRATSSWPCCKERSEALLRAVGAGMVWLPVAIYLLATGGVWQGILLIGYGVLVIGLVDNLGRPVLVGKDTKMPDYVVLISMLGASPSSVSTVF